MRRLALALCCVFLALVPAAGAVPGPTVRFATSLGNIDVVLLGDDAPNTVANFLRYVDEGAYTGSFIHRSQANFVIQGGGYRYASDQIQPIATHEPVANEFRASNVRGTLAMAKVPGQPNSATSQWFFNKVDNSSSLDTENGGHTVFGRIVDDPSLAVMDRINALATKDFGSPFTQLPVRPTYVSGSPNNDHLVVVSSIARVFGPQATPTPTYAVPTATPFTLKKRNVAIKRTAKRVRVTVTGVPAKTLISVMLKAGRRTFRAASTATSKGRAVVKVKALKRAGRLRVKATPPGQKSSAVRLKVKRAS